MRCTIKTATGIYLRLLCSCTSGGDERGMAGTGGASGVGGNAGGVDADCACMAQCVATTCPDSDECSTPANFTPPPDVKSAGSSSSAGIGSGSLANTSWTLLDVRVGPLGEVVLVDNPSAACWHSSHHNFNDWAHAWSGNRHYSLAIARTGHGAAPTYALHVFKQGPLAAGGCAPTAEGSCPIGDAIELLPVNP